MEINAHYESGDAKTFDVDFSLLSKEDLIPFANLALPGALEAMKKLVGYDWLKPVSDMNAEDVRYYMDWMRSNNPEKHASLEKQAASVTDAESK